MKLWNSLINFGTDGLTAFDAKQIRLVNRLCISLAAITFFFIGKWGLEKNGLMILGNIIPFLFYVLALFCNKKKLHALASSILIFNTSTVFFALSGMIGSNSPLHYCLTSFSAFSIVLFKRENKSMIFLGILYPLILLFILIYKDFQVFPVHFVNNFNTSPILDYLVNFTIILVTIISFYNYYIGAEDRLSLLYQEHLKDQELIHEERARSLVNSKMAALGEMAGGIAHEINNPLFVIKATSQSMIRDILKDGLNKEEILEKIRMIEKTCSRITNIIRSLKTISGSAENTPIKSCDLKSLIEDTLILCQHRFYQANYPVNVIYETPHCQVMVRPVEIVQILVNLLNNAYDALEGAPDPHLNIRITEDRHFLLVNIEDNGSGIPPEFQYKVFETFYTSKPTDKGTGLGLPISKKLAENNNGDISFVSEPGKTVFTLKLCY